jgi:hypothetical protein
MVPSDDASLGRCVPKTMRPLEGMSHERYVLWTVRPLDDASLGWCVSWKISPLRTIPEWDRVDVRMRQVRLEWASLGFARAARRAPSATQAKRVAVVVIIHRLGGPGSGLIGQGRIVQGDVPSMERIVQGASAPVKTKRVGTYGDGRTHIHGIIYITSNISACSV